MRYFESGAASARMDAGGVLFDLSGTPMDQDWHCPLERLSEKADVLRQTWPEEILREMFAEAARLQPGLPVEPPPPGPIAVVPRIPSLRRRTKRLSEKRITSHGAEEPAIPRGLELSALQALMFRVAAAAHAIDADFPLNPGVLALDSVDLDERSERRSYSAGKDREVRIVVDAEVRDGIGGPVPYPQSASFYVAGLRQGCSIRGSWDGVAAQAEVECPDELRERLTALLSG